MKSKVFKDPTTTLHPPVDACPKCGGKMFSGPKYVEPVHIRGVYVPEVMEWTCDRCEWIGVGPTLQTTGNWPPAAKTE